MADLLQSLTRHGETYDIKAAVNELAGTEFSLDGTKEEQEDELTLWNEAERFLETLVADLSEFGYRGEIARRSSTPLRGDVLAANRTEIRRTQKRDLLGTMSRNFSQIWNSGPANKPKATNSWTHIKMIPMSRAIEEGNK